MRIARVLHGESPVPVLALEVGGALYDVAELDRHFDNRWFERAPSSSDFYTRVGALACAGMGELDHALRTGHHPRDARLLPGSYSLLAPCATDRAQLVLVHPSERGDPSYAFGSARSLAGHAATIPFPPNEQAPDLELAIAAILGEEVHRVGADAADRAILGYAIFAGWVARGVAARGGHATARARDFCPQLGPTLVTRDEIGDLREHIATIRTAEKSWNLSAPGTWPLLPAEAIAFVSQHVALEAGDVIATYPTPLGEPGGHRLPLRWNEAVSITVGALGTLTGRPVVGAVPPAWRRRQN